MLKQMAPLPTISATTYINECGSFFEKETELAFVQQNIPFEKGTQDLVLEFSGTNCEEFDFQFDDPDAFKVEIFQ